jgi:hypothetical protein
MCWDRHLWGKFVVLMAMLCVSLGACTGSTAHRSTPSPTPPLSLRTSEILAVIGVQQGKNQLSSADSQGLQDRRIGFGLSKLLAESLYDTGKFRLVEEKDLHKRELIEDLVHIHWIVHRANYSERELRRVATQLRAELLAFGTISYRSFRESISAGPISRVVQKLRIQANVCLYEVFTDAILCREGQGEAEQERRGVIYEPSDDRLDFEKNAAGIATKLAVARAVQDLVAGIQFSP